MVKAHIPVYLPDRTQVGYAEIETVGNITHIDIQVPANSPLAELTKENLVGLSVMYMDRNQAEEIINKEGEETDGRQKALDS